MSKDKVYSQNKNYSHGSSVKSLLSYIFGIIGSLETYSSVPEFKTSLSKRRKLLKDTQACKRKRITIKRTYLRQGLRKKNNYKCRKSFFKHYGKQDKMYSGGLQHVSGFMSATLDQWPELMRCYMLPGTWAGKLLFWCTLESGEFQKSSIWWKTEQPSVAQRSLTSGI